MRKPDEQSFLEQMLVIGNFPGCAMNTVIGYTPYFIEPDMKSATEVIPGGESRTPDKIVFQKPETLFLFALAVRVPDRTGERTEAVMLCKVQKTLIPDNLTLFPATENSSSHVIEIMCPVSLCGC